MVSPPPITGDIPDSKPMETTDSNDRSNQNKRRSRSNSMRPNSSNRVVDNHRRSRSRSRTSGRGRHSR